jgi:hypothetical protein
MVDRIRSGSVRGATYVARNKITKTVKILQYYNTSTKYCTKENLSILFMKVLGVDQRTQSTIIYMIGHK